MSLRLFDETLLNKILSRHSSAANAAIEQRIAEIPEDDDKDYFRKRMRSAVGLISEYFREVNLEVMDAAKGERAEVFLITIGTLKNDVITEAHYPNGSDILYNFIDDVLRQLPGIKETLEGGASFTRRFAGSDPGGLYR